MTNVAAVLPVLSLKDQINPSLKKWTAIHRKRPAGRTYMLAQSAQLQVALRAEMSPRHQLLLKHQQTLDQKMTQIQGISNPLLHKTRTTSRSEAPVQSSHTIMDVKRLSQVLFFLSATKVTSTDRPPRSSSPVAKTLAGASKAPVDPESSS